MTDDRRNEQGQFVAEYPDEDFLVAVRNHEPAGTSDVAEQVGCTIQNADYRLRKLRQDGRVEGKKVGRTLVWTLTDDAAE